ncbi:MAG TPA: hypothetical protein VFR47_17685 [Anaerolineales bacterium]|nr:hypothetical protein [Anaerolineales bacterium]
MPSITGWTRLEPRPRSADFALTLQARVRDPLWMLARQWQVGEFQGEDAGSPIATRLEMDVAPVNRYRPGSAEGISQPYDPRQIPLEALVERETVRSVEVIDLRFAAEAGLYFLRLLKAHNLDERYRTDYVAQYPLSDITELGAGLDVGSRRFLAVMRGRAPDGAALEADLRPALEAEPPTLPDEPAIDSIDAPAVLLAAREWLAWWDSFFFEPEMGQIAQRTAWVPERLEYQFSVSASEGEGELVLAAREYYEGTLDWYSFDVQRGTSLGGEPGPGVAQTLVQAVMPTGVDFDGMPSPRWWEFEDGRVDFGRVDAAPDDLARLLLLEFALVYGNDWLMIPVRLDVGSLCRVRSLVVTDTFGERVEVPASAQPADPTAAWGLFYLAELGRSLTQRIAPQEQVFFLAPSLATSVESPPVEDVLFIRDEMANLAWAIERKVQGPMERPIDRFEAYQEKQRQRETPEAPPAEGAVVAYHLATTVPDHWIPLVPVHVGTGQRAIALQRGAMLDPETGEAILAQGRILTPNQRLILEDEEVPRVGAQVTRSFQHARWTDGTSLLWAGRRKRAGRGEGSSGLHFDTI